MSLTEPVVVENFHFKTSMKAACYADEIALNMLQSTLDNSNLIKSNLSIARNFFNPLGKTYLCQNKTADNSKTFSAIFYLYKSKRHTINLYNSKFNR